MRINEIFYSLQGEGHFAGTPAVFVRFAGCNLQCPFCDTDFHSFTTMSIDEVMNEIKKYPARRVVLTGGEPTLQLTAEFIDRLHREEFRIHIETNGTKCLPAPVDWLTCSPKGGKMPLV
ncbi:MAG: 7-carboxy-7-deazaguanine synthase QueE, partial [Muribaculum sp.]|nr:7-carboxy-7-deazaguanine synthase QueE [Muribaculum sp.]